jgi:DNA-binding LacI/PurR family transcriptional regulator
MNGDARVKESTRKRVLRVAKQLRYYPNLHARSLAGGKSRTIGIIVSNLDNPFFVDVIRHLELLADQRGLDTVVSATHYEPERLRKHVKSMLGRRVAGIAAIVSEMESHVIDELANAGIPVVFYDVGRAGGKITNIRFDYRKGMRMLVEHLHSLGHRRMTFVAYPGHLGPTEDRRESFLETAKLMGVAAEVVVARADGFEAGTEAAERILLARARPSAILCVNDTTAVGVLHKLGTEGISVPGEIAVTGFDNIPLTQYTHPPLTTIHIARDRIASLAMDALALASGRQGPAGQELMMGPELIVRQSTGRVAGAL